MEELKELLWRAKEQAEPVSEKEMNRLIDAGLTAQNEWWENEDLTYSWTDPDD